MSANRTKLHVNKIRLFWVGSRYNVLLKRRPSLSLRANVAEVTDHVRVL